MNNFNSSNNVAEAAPYAAPNMSNSEIENYYGNGANFNQGQNFNQGNLFGQAPAFNQGANNFYSQAQNMAVPQYQNQMPNPGMNSSVAFMQGQNFNNFPGNGFNSAQGAAIGAGAGAGAVTGAGAMPGYGSGVGYSARASAGMGAGGAAGTGSDAIAGDSARVSAGAGVSASAGAGYNRGYGKEGYKPYKSYNSRYGDGSNNNRQEQASKKIAFNIECNFGAIGEPDRNGWVKEFTFTSWSDHPGKYDIRCWSPDHTSMQKGLNFSRDELAKLYVLINKAKDQDQTLASLISQELEREYPNNPSLSNAAQANDFNSNTTIGEPAIQSVDSSLQVAITPKHDQGTTQVNQYNGFSTEQGSGNNINSVLTSNVCNISQEDKTQVQEHTAHAPSGEYILLKESNGASNVAANTAANAVVNGASNVTSKVASNAAPNDAKVNKAKLIKGKSDFFYSDANNLDSNTASDMAVSLD